MDPGLDPVAPSGDPPDQPNENPNSRPPTRGSARRDYPPWDPAAEIKALRLRMRLTQRQFAGWFGFPAATLRHWERGNRQPTGSALVLLSVIRENPQIVLRAVRKARMYAPGSLPEIEPLKTYRAPPGFSDGPPPVRRKLREGSGP